MILRLLVCFTRLRISSDPPLWELLQVQNRRNKKIGAATPFCLWPPYVHIFKDVREPKSEGGYEKLTSADTNIDFLLSSPQSLSFGFSLRFLFYFNAFVSLKQLFFCCRTLNLLK